VNKLKAIIPTRQNPQKQASHRANHTIPSIDPLNFNPKNIMKKLILLALSATSMVAYALPTYEPFTEYSALITAGGGSVDLGTSGFYVTNGAVVEQWGGGSSGFGLFFSQGTPTATAYQEVIVTNNPATVFTSANLAAILPSGFPGAGSDINITAYIPQNAGANTAGNSAVLKFAQDIPRPTNGVITVYVSYLLNCSVKGTTVGAGNVGRYAGFLSQTNIYEGTGSGGAYLFWTNLFNTFSATGPNYVSYGQKINSPAITGGNNILPSDSSAGNSGGTGNAGVGVVYNTANFVVGCYTFSSSKNDTNSIWVNPPTSDFGGTTPSSATHNTYRMVNIMSDVDAFFMESRSGSSLGGNSPSYLGNLLIGTTWSYVTGGPEFTNQPASVTISSQGGTASFTGDAVAAAQSVTYQWQHVVGGTTNTLTDGVGTAGGAATVSGSGTHMLTLTGVTTGDTEGFYQLVATASGTGFKLSSQAVSILSDPFIDSSPSNFSVNYGGTATFTAAAHTTQPTMSYQWYLGSTPLVDGVQGDGSTVAGSSGTVSGPTLTTTLTIANVSYLDDGNYSVVVTNNINNDNSSTPAILTVNDPYLIFQPNGSSLVLTNGGSGSISVSAAGTGVIYQWYGVNHGLLSNTGDFSGVGTSTLTITNAQSSDADNYYCVVSGASGQNHTTLGTPVYVQNPAIGPFAPNDWPPTYAQNASADYAIWDANWAGTYPGSPWNNVMSLAPSSGDQTWTTSTILGANIAYQMTGTYLAIRDPNWTNYENVPSIDILLNVYGNGGMYDASGNGLATTLREGQTTTQVAYVHQGSFPLGANNGQWNWVLLTFTNAIDANGYRYVGDPSVGTTGYGGVNGATVSLYGGSGGFGVGPFIVRAVAMGPHGAFGTADQINRFAAPASCSPEPTNNLAWIDFNLGTSNNLSVMNNPGLGETYTVASGIGPAGDQRTAIQSSGLMEMPILNNYLGYSCNQNLSMQVCFELYDDPSLAGATFGPYSYAADYQGDLASYTGSPYTLTGSGQWIKVCFFVGPLNLNGVNTAPLTGGPLILFNGTAPYIDRVEVGLIRTGTNALAGQIPDSDYHINPFICGTNYGYYAEWNPTTGVTTNVVMANGYSSTLAGPVGNQLVCEQPNPAGGGYYYEDWNLTNQVFGPNLQDNADVIMNMTYYDDPSLAGVGITNTLFPNVYSTLVDGNLGVISPSLPYGQPFVLKGTGKWQVAQFELPDVNFQNTSVQHVCRFASSAPIYVSRVQFNVLRPCGSFEGVDYLQSLGMNNTNAQINLNWRGQASLQGASTVAGAYNAVVTATNTVTNVYSLPMTNSAEFFRLQIPGYPTYMPGDAP
jgi:hypothetical protein